MEEQKSETKKRSVLRPSTSAVWLTIVCNNREEACHHEPPLFPDIYILLHLENIMMQCINKHETNKYYTFKIL